MNIQGQKGFTLVEILIAITILGFVSIGTITITNNSYDAHERITNEDKDFFQFQMAMDRILGDLEQIYTPLFYSTFQTKFTDDQNSQPDPVEDEENAKNIFPVTKTFPEFQANGLPVPFFDNPNTNSFVFFTSSYKRRIENEKNSHFSWIKLSLEKGDSDQDDDEETLRPNGLYQVVRQVITSNLYQDDLDWSRVKKQVLLKHVKDFDFYFWNQEKEKWTTRLKDLNSNEQKKVRMIKVALTYYDSSGEELSTIRVVKPHWPLFDAKKEQEMLDQERRKAQRQNKSNKNNNTNNNN